MKNRLVLLLFLSAASVLSAQNTQQIFIYVPEITGAGLSSEDNAYIAFLLTEEIEARHYYTVASPGKADFILIGAIDLEMQEDDDFFFYAYVLHLALQNAQTEEILAEQELVYNTLDELHYHFSMMMYHIFSQNLYKDDINDWRDRWLYLGLCSYWSPRVYSGKNQETSFANFGGAFSAELHFNKLLSFETGTELVPDWIVVSDAPGDDYRDLMLEIPASLKLVIKLSDHYMLEPYAGVHVNVPLYRNTAPPAFSWMIGFQYGVKAGPGVFFVDPRFSMDIGKSRLDTKDGRIYDYQRYIIHIGFGYKFGFFSKRGPGN